MDRKRLHTVGKRPLHTAGKQPVRTDRNREHNATLQLSPSGWQKIRRTDGTDDSHTDHNTLHKDRKQPLHTVGKQPAGKAGTPAVRKADTLLVHRDCNHAKPWTVVQKYLLRQLQLPQK